MITLMGTGIYGGIAIGKLRFFHREDSAVPRRTVSDTESECEAYVKASLQAISELKDMYQKALREIDEESAAIFEIHSMMLEDTDFQNEILGLIRGERVNAEYAVYTVSCLFSEGFEKMEDPYMNARAADIRDISHRLLTILSGKNPQKFSVDEGNIICAEDLTPSEVMELSRKKIAAFITANGSSSSHTAILAKSMGIPSVIGVGSDLMTLTDGADTIVDGFSGSVYISPDKDTKRKMSNKLIDERNRKALLEQYKGLDNVTLDGRRIEIYANIQSLYELQAAIDNDAGGIGLFRSEFIYLDRTDLPSEDGQFEIYRAVIEGIRGKKVIIRTLDIGADKKADYFQFEHEDNPALGFRAIRMCLSHPEIFKPQLRAILRASVYGNASVMFPMICSLPELSRVLSLLRETRAELDARKIPYSKELEVGIMIETPAAAIISDKLAPLVDFFSIGTNDLTQYTLALDRQNRKLDGFFDPHHEAIMRLIETTVKNAHSHGKWVGICGELAADLTLTESFLQMGVDELSVSPTFVLPLRDKIRNTDLGEISGNKG